MTTKAQIAKLALSNLGVTGFDYEIDPEELKDCVIQLEYLMADWDARGIKCGYWYADDPEVADISSESGLPDIAVRAVARNLSLEIADSYGKQVSDGFRASASAALSSLLSALVYVPTQKHSNRMPVGSGNQRMNNWRLRYYPPARDTIDADNAGPIQTNGQGDLTV